MKTELASEVNQRDAARVGSQPPSEPAMVFSTRCKKDAWMILGGAGGRSTRDAEIGPLPHYSVRTPSLLCHYLEAEVGIEPRSKTSNRRELSP
jgi:hypothetical protein